MSESHIYVKLIGTGGPPLRLTTGSASDYSPAWSPDGRYIAFLRHLSPGKERGAADSSPGWSGTQNCRSVSIGLLKLYRSDLVARWQFACHQ